MANASDHKAAVHAASSTKSPRNGNRSYWSRWNSDNKNHWRNYSYRKNDWYWDNKMNDWMRWSEQKTSAASFDKQLKSLLGTVNGLSKKLKNLEKLHGKQMKLINSTSATELKPIVSPPISKKLPKAMSYPNSARSHLQQKMSTNENKHIPQNSYSRKLFVNSRGKNTAPHNHFKKHLDAFDEIGNDFQAASPFDSQWNHLVLVGEAKAESYATLPYSNDWNDKLVHASKFKHIHENKHPSAKHLRRLDGHCCRTHEDNEREKNETVNTNIDFESANPFDLQWAIDSRAGSARNSGFAVSPFDDKFYVKMLKGSDLQLKLRELQQEKKGMRRTQSTPIKEVKKAAPKAEAKSSARGRSAEKTSLPSPRAKHPTKNMTRIAKEIAAGPSYQQMKTNVQKETYSGYHNFDAKAVDQKLATIIPLHSFQKEPLTPLSASQLKPAITAPKSAPQKAPLTPRKNQRSVKQM